MMTHLTLSKKIIEALCPHVKWIIYYPHMRTIENRSVINTTLDIKYEKNAINELELVFGKFIEIDNKSEYRQKSDNLQICYSPRLFMEENVDSFVLTYVGYILRHLYSCFYEIHHIPNLMISGGIIPRIIENLYDGGLKSLLSPKSDIDFWAFGDTKNIILPVTLQRKQGLKLGETYDSMGLKFEVYDGPKIIAPFNVSMKTQLMVCESIRNPEKITEYFDFVHLTSYWLKEDGKLYTSMDILNLIKTKQLRHQISFEDIDVKRIEKYKSRGYKDESSSDF